MTRDYFKSPEGEAAYKAINWPYPEELYDQAYDKFIKLTKNTKEKDYKIYIQNMKRLILKTGEEFILYDMSERKLDPLGNIKTFLRGNIGKYGKPIPHYEIKVNADEGYVKEKYVSHIDMIEDCYSIPFTQENIDKLQKHCDGNTTYSIQKRDYRAGMTFSIESIRDWREGKTKELLRFGHIASSFEKQILEDEKIGKFQSTPSPTAGAYRLLVNMTDEDDGDNLYFIRDPKTGILVRVDSYEDFRNLKFHDLLKKYNSRKGN